MMNKYDQRACIAYAEKKGREEGKEEGLVQGVMQTAKNMLKEGLNPMHNQATAKRNFGVEQSLMGNHSLFCLW